MRSFVAFILMLIVGTVSMGADDKKTPETPKVEGISPDIQVDDAKLTNIPAIRKRLSGEPLLLNVIRDYPKQPAPLVGLDLGFTRANNRPVITFVRAVYQVDEKRVEGTPIGVKPVEITSIHAKPGHVVVGAQASINTDGAVDAVSLQFAKMENGEPDTKSTYDSPWVGTKGFLVNTTGRPQAYGGLYLKFKDDSIIAFGLLSLPEAGYQSEFFGPTANVDYYQDIGDDRAMLMGFRIGLSKINKEERIQSIQPIYLAGRLEEFGKIHGAKAEKTFDLKAKEGYAVGGIKLSANPEVDGLALIYYKIDGKRLNRDDAYASAWMGFDSKKDKSVIGSSLGYTVIGISGCVDKKNSRNVSLGLIYLPAPKK